jgi:hypothetical protein
MVQAPILQAMSNVLKKLSDEQTRTLRQLARKSAGAEDLEVREAALFLVANSHTECDRGRSGIL